MTTGMDSLGYRNDYLNGSNTQENVLSAYRRLTGRSVDRRLAKSIVVKDKNGVIDGIVLFTDRTASSAAIHIHLPKLLTKKIIKDSLNYGFTTMGVIRLYAEIRSDNKIMLRIAEKLGFNQIAALPDRYDIGVDQIVMVASENDVAKWIK